MVFAYCIVIVTYGYIKQLFILQTKETYNIPNFEKVSFNIPA